MQSRTAFSLAHDPEVAAAAIVAGLAPIRPRLLVYFASPVLDHAELSARFKAAFPAADCIGCTTAGELVSGQMLKKSVVAMALPVETVAEAAVAVVRDVRSGDALAEAIRSLEATIGHPLRTVDPARYVGLILIDGMSGMEESVMETLGDVTDVVFIGGSAGDDLAFRSTRVSANGESYEHAAVLALLRPARPFEFLKTQSFVNLEKRLTPTKVDEATRTVLEFNGRAAADAYAEALGVPREDLATRFMSNPLGLMTGGRPYVRSPRVVTESGGIAFYCGIREGIELSVLQSTQIVEDTTRALANECANGPVSAIINFHCILRTLELEQEGQTEAYGRVFADVAMVGFSTYGEQFVGHINQTAAMLLIR
jgi:hypothetical protein